MVDHIIRGHSLKKSHIFVFKDVEAEESLLDSIFRKKSMKNTDAKGKKENRTRKCGLCHNEGHNRVR